MPKMIPHRIIHKRMKEHELFRKLKGVTGHSLLDEPANFMDIECEAFYIFPLSFKDHHVIKMLADDGKMFLEADDNIVFLPTKPAQAYILGKSHYSDPPIESYIDLVKGEFDRILSSETYKLCQAGDDQALNRLRDHLVHIRTAIKDGLESAKLHAAFPYTDEHYQRDEVIRKNMTKQ